MINNNYLENKYKRFELIKDELCKQVVLRDYMTFYERNYLTSLYIDLIGKLQYQIFSLRTELQTLETKKTMMIDSLKEHQKLNIKIIEETIDQNYDDYYTIIKIQKKEVKAAQMRLLSIDERKKDINEACKLYEMILRHCHPALFPQQNKKLYDLFLQAKTAFKIGYFNVLEKLSLSIDLDNKNILSSDELQKQLISSQAFLYKIKIEKENLFLEFPFNMKEFLRNDVWIKKNQAELSSIISNLKEERDKLKQIICLIEK